MQLSLLPGSDIPEPALSVPILFYVLSGEGTVLVEGEEQAVVAGEMVECPPGFSRGWKNGRDGVLVIKGA